MALGQNSMAMSYFTNLTLEQKEDLIGKTHGVTSKREMQQLVDDMASGTINYENGIYTPQFPPRFNI